MSSKYFYIVRKVILRRNECRACHDTLFMSCGCRSDVGIRIVISGVVGPIFHGCHVGIVVQFEPMW